MLNAIIVTFFTVQKIQQCLKMKYVFHISLKILVVSIEQQGSNPKIFNKKIYFESSSSFQKFTPAEIILFSMSKKKKKKKKINLMLQKMPI